MNTEWKPIASAPKDGTEILVFHPEGGVCAAFCPGDGFAWHCMDGMNTVIGKKSRQSIPAMTSFTEPPTHWMPLPPAPTSHPIPTGATGEDDIVQRLRDNADLDAAEDGNPAVIRLEREAADEIDRLRRALADTPAAGDALDAARLDWLEQHDGRFYNKDRISSIVGVGFLVAGDLTGMRHQSVRAAIDAAIVQQKGEA